MEQVIPLLEERRENLGFIIQITTKGGEMGVISKNLKRLNGIFEDLPQIITNKFRVEILTEKDMDRDAIDAEGYVFPLRFYVVPNDFRTLKGTKFKARALQYMIELRKEIEEKPLDQLFIIHFDAESVLTRTGLLSIIHSILTKNSKTILQGPIIYPNNWFRAGLFSRQMESLRPWNCYECYRSTSNGVPYHLHGSNIVIRADVEETVGWDFGKVDGYPVVAEDLFFGVKAYLRYGDGIFGWHGAEMHEQPAFSLVDSMKQRVRWIRGSLQAIRSVPEWPEYGRLDDKAQRGFLFRMKFKIFFYALGFIPAFIAVSTLLFFLGSLAIESVSAGQFVSLGETTTRVNHFLMPMVPRWMLQFSLLGALMWLISIQVGLYHNIKTLQLDPITRLVEHLKILFITPIATLFDTGVVFFTVLSWVFGNREARWEVTPKTVSRTNL